MEQFTASLLLIIFSTLITLLHDSYCKEKLDASHSYQLKG